jgi:arsenate reductase
LPVTLFHNPRCSTSRNALALLRERGVEPEIVDYLKTGWDAATLNRLAAETAWAAAFGGCCGQRRGAPRPSSPPTPCDAAILKAMIADPILVERPIVETEKGARIGRPIERVLEVL